jgi:hypothetical protein
MCPATYSQAAEFPCEAHLLSDGNSQKCNHRQLCGVS